ncbi:hypothetical protein MFFC18_26040 [Mariniblastus fucicola]|uniref:Uncharacterized protein n=1 Tax=Mariniblastus fucicola TaxID=980251 RepID=A0A5B9PJ34_9BACT|nr:hypothetical protein MFFC18_26040 [Mariniblastus fucicola]
MEIADPRRVKTNGNTWALAAILKVAKTWEPSCLTNRKVNSSDQFKMLQWANTVAGEIALNTLNSNVLHSNQDTRDLEIDNLSSRLNQRGRYPSLIQETSVSFHSWLLKP